MKNSKFGSTIGSHSGIMQLMDDLGEALTVNPHMRMLGGGNPAAIPQVQATWRRQIAKLTDDGSLDRMLLNYDPPRGNPRFLHSLAEFLKKHCNWPVTADNLAVTPGGQTAFFILFNLLAGETKHGTNRKILFPIAPEYVGYRDQSLGDQTFRSLPAKIELIGDHDFKYRIDKDQIHTPIDDDIAAFCISRPTNPSGNVVSASEVDHLKQVAQSAGIHLIIDNAYGQPFPGVIFNEAPINWESGMIFTLSLSKLGLPGTRTGIVIADPEVTRAVSQALAVLGLANCNVGQYLVMSLLEDGSLIELCENVIRPFYQRKAEKTRQVVADEFGDAFAYRVHVIDGAFFLWIWFPDLPCTTLELYEKLKQREVVVVPGEYFFYGLDADWSHQRQCIRVSFAQDDKIVREGIEIIADEVRSLIANSVS